jgi:hypothetical protein
MPEDKMTAGKLKKIIQCFSSQNALEEAAKRGKEFVAETREMIKAVKELKNSDEYQGKEDLEKFCEAFMTDLVKELSEPHPLISPVLNNTGNRKALINILTNCASQWYSAESKVLNTFKALEPTRSSGFFGSWSKEADEQRIAAYNSCIQLISPNDKISLSTKNIGEIEKHKSNYKKLAKKTTKTREVFLDTIAEGLQKFGNNIEAKKVFVALCSSKTLKKYGTRDAMAESAKKLVGRPDFIDEAKQGLEEQSQSDKENKNDEPDNIKSRTLSR